MSRKWVVVFLVLAIGAAAGTWFYRSLTVSASAEEKELVTVQRLDFPLIVAAPGIVEARQSVSIGPPKIRDVHRYKLSRMVEEGKVVDEGDFLLEFDGSDLNLQLRDQTAYYQREQENFQKKRSDFDISLRDLKLQLEQAKSDADKLDNKLSRQAELESAIVIAETKIRRDAAREKVTLLERKVASLTESGRIDLQISTSNQRFFKNRMDTLLDAIDSLTVRAPVAGVVIYKRDWNNEPRQIGSYVDNNNTVMELPDLKTLRAKVYVDEVDAGKVKIGQEASVQVDAVQGRVFKGKLVGLSTILKQLPPFDRPQRVVEAYLLMEGSDLNLVRPGMSTRAQVMVGSYPKVIVIPLSCIQEKSGRSFVQVWQPEKKAYDWREIQLMTNDGLTAVVNAGLEANEKVRSKPKA
jgi:HlyD family secretion protein